MLTEDAAREKWCPFTFAPYEPPGHVNYGGGGASWTQTPAGFRCKCIASDCMAWRRSKDGGYCGLAGRSAAAHERSEAEPNAGTTKG